MVKQSDQTEEHTEPTIKTILEDVTKVFKTGELSLSIKHTYALSLVEHLIKEKFMTPQSIISLGERYLKGPHTHI